MGLTSGRQDQASIPYSQSRIIYAFSWILTLKGAKILEVRGLPFVWEASAAIFCLLTVLTSNAVEDILL